MSVSPEDLFELMRDIDDTNPHGIIPFTPLESRLLTMFKMGALDDYELAIIYDRNTGHLGWPAVSRDELKGARAELSGRGYLRPAQVGRWSLV